ncbi:MAG: EamA family transporter, partial [Geminicoccaceae bacterium]
MPLKNLFLALALPVLWGVGSTLLKPAAAHFPPLLLMSIAYLVILLALRPGAGSIRTPWRSLALIAALGATIQG